MRLLRVGLFSVVTMLVGWSSAAMAEGEEDTAYVGYIELKPFVTNFDGGDRLRFLKAEVTVQVDQEIAHHYINSHKAQIRNDLLFLFAEQTEQDVKGVAAQTTLAGKALDVVQKAMIAETGEPQAADLFFTSFVIQ
jgi:flagellar FliL protein